LSGSCPVSMIRSRTFATSSNSLSYRSA